MSNVVIVESFKSSKKSEYIRFVETLGADVHFADDKWVCDKLRRSPADADMILTLCFDKIPKQHRDMVKFYCVICFIKGLWVRTIKGEVSRIIIFLNFWIAAYKNAGLQMCDDSTAISFYQHLEEIRFAESTRARIWSSISSFLKRMDGWDNTHLRNPFSVSPYHMQKKFDDKFIPESVTLQLDNVFKDDKIALHLRCAYWLLRLIPSRISEVVGIRIDCLKRYNGHYVLFIPTWKQNGGGREPIMRSIHLEEAGIAGHLISLIQKQQDIARELQEYMPEHKKCALFTHRCRTKKSHYAGQYMVATGDSIQSAFKNICLKHSITDSDGRIYEMTTHQLRHNGITDRLAAGFTSAQIAEMTGHHGNAMILNSYNHLDLMPETIVEKQEYVLQEPVNRENRYVLFGGRILNMEEQLEKRLLRNLRSHKVRGGICSDITGCKSDMWNCLECGFFVPDARQLNYYKEQILHWREKSIRFSNFPVIKGNAEKNADLYEHIFKKLREDECQ